MPSPISTAVLLIFTISASVFTMAETACDDVSWGKDMRSLYRLGQEVEEIDKNTLIESFVRFDENQWRFVRNTDTLKPMVSAWKTLDGNYRQRCFTPEVTIFFERWVTLLELLYGTYTTTEIHQWLATASKVDDHWMLDFLYPSTLLSFNRDDVAKAYVQAYFNHPEKQEYQPLAAAIFYYHYGVIRKHKEEGFVIDALSLKNMDSALARIPPSNERYIQSKISLRFVSALIHSGGALTPKQLDAFLRKFDDEYDSLYFILSMLSENWAQYFKTNIHQRLVTHYINGLFEIPLGEQEDLIVKLLEFLTPETIEWNRVEPLIDLIKLQPQTEQLFFIRERLAERYKNKTELLAVIEERLTENPFSLAYHERLCAITESENDRLTITESLIESIKMSDKHNDLELLNGAYGLKLDILLASDAYKEAALFLGDIRRESENAAQAALHTELLLTLGDTEQALSESTQALHRLGYEPSTIGDSFLTWSEDEIERYYDNEMTPLLYEYAEAQLGSGNQQAAMDIWQHLYVATDNTVYLQKLGSAYQHNKEYEKAQDFYAQYLASEEDFYIRTEMTINAALLAGAEQALVIRQGLEPRNEAERYLVSKLDFQLGHISEEEFLKATAGISPSLLSDTELYGVAKRIDRLERL